MCRPRLLFVLLIVLSAPGSAMAADRVTGEPFATRSEVIAPHAMAATSQPLATQIALEILRLGGSAVDATIAANAALGLMEPTGCGIGGDLFAMVWDPGEEKLHGLNASGRSPRSLTLAEFTERGLEHVPAFGVLPISVPGCVDGWFELHDRFGKLPMDQVLAPAIRYCRDGFPVSELIAHYWQLSVAGRADHPFFLETFTRDGRAPVKGEMWTNEPLARTYETIAEHGRDAFYRGDLARVIARTVGQAGGFLEYEDLDGHRSEWVEPVSTDYRGVDVWELPPNGQGIAALQILNIMEGFDVAGLGFGSPEYVHAFVEAKKLAFADRARFYADMDFADVPVDELISKEYAARRRAEIDPFRAARSVDAGNPALRQGDTIYLTVADSDGMMVSFIQSNYRGMGSGVCPEGLGFGLQDRGELFTLEPGQANTYAPGKRPFHTIIPAFATRNGEPWLSFGVMGGGTQPQAHAQIIMNLVDFGMNLQEAGDAPRMLHWGGNEPTGRTMNDGGNVALETGIPYATRRALTDLGHHIVVNVGSFGGYQAIMIDREQGVYYGASESRKDGQAAGY
ncbi:MAG: gamma-glutamyltransferase [bacterium]|nr:gamma-glutamyltransferase [bacterium]